MIRGRGMIQQQGQRRPKFIRGPPKSIPKPLIDMVLLKEMFPALTPSPLEESDLKAIEDKVTNLKPTEVDLKNMNQIIEGLETVLNALIASKDEFKLTSFKRIGAFTKGVMLRGWLEEDFMLEFEALLENTLETLPNVIINKLVASKCVWNISSYTCIPIVGGFTLQAPQTTLNFFANLTAENNAKCPEIARLPDYVLEANGMAVRRTEWMLNRPENVKKMAMLLLDMRRRYEGFSILSPFMAEAFASYVSQIGHLKDAEVVPMVAAFKRALQLLAGGMFICGAEGVRDPTNGKKWIHNPLTQEQQDSLCMTAQDLLRISFHGGLAVILQSTLDFSQSSWTYNGITIKHSEKVFEREASNTIMET